MNISAFFEHWSVVENPFRAEEARHDPVFTRLGLGAGACMHADFEKILGDLSHPSTSIVFGEKGSGKTALRLQMARRIAEHNASCGATSAGAAGRPVFLISYDDLNPTLDRFFTNVRLKNKTSDREGALRVLQRFTLADHMDAILHVGVTSLMDRLLADPPREPAATPEAIDAHKSLRHKLKRLDPAVKRDLTLLQLVYDRHGEPAGKRTAILRRKLRGAANWHPLLWRTLALLGWLPLAGVVALYIWMDQQRVPQNTWLIAAAIAGVIWLLLLAKHLLLDRWWMLRLASRLAKGVRSLPNSTDELAEALNLVPRSARAVADLPLDDSEDTRYEMFSRLDRALTALGYGGAVVIVDRLDEPSLIAGDPDRMKAVAWPMFRGKFLQQHGFGIKLLLPIELRHELFRESQAFFQEARLDKQNMIERLNWTGAALYDLCDARLRACLKPDAPAVGLADLFDPEVGIGGLVSALEQMHQPRDAFKLLYQCISEQCANVVQDEARYTISKDTLDVVRKHQAERVQLVARGLRPA